MTGASRAFEGETTMRALVLDGGDWQGYLHSVADKTPAIRRFGSPEELTSFFVFLCSDKAGCGVSSTYFVDGGMQKTM